MKNQISEKQKTILDFIKLEVSDKGYPPTVREICKAVNLKSPSTVHTHLNKLEKLGYIKRDPTKPRALVISEKSYDLGDKDGNIKNNRRNGFDDSISNNISEINKVTSFVPIIGEITAGEPILAHQELDGTFPIPTNIVDDGDYYMLKIKGESMVEAGILDKDLVLVRQQQDANNGDIVVALLDDSATVKTFYKENSHIRLQPENSSMSPIIVENVSILGIVKGVFRTM